MGWLRDAIERIHARRHLSENGGQPGSASCKPKAQSEQPKNLHNRSFRIISARDKVKTADPTFKTSPRGVQSVGNDLQTSN